jgi:hypothetical protein
MAVRRDEAAMNQMLQHAPSPHRVRTNVCLRSVRWWRFADTARTIAQRPELATLLNRPSLHQLQDEGATPIHRRTIVPRPRHRAAATQPATDQTGGSRPDSEMRRALASVWLVIGSARQKQ